MPKIMRQNLKDILQRNASSLIKMVQNWKKSWHIVIVQQFSSKKVLFILSDVDLLQFAYLYVKQFCNSAFLNFHALLSNDVVSTLEKKINRQVYYVLSIYIKRKSSIIYIFNNKVIRRITKVLWNELILYFH